MSGSTDKILQALGAEQIRRLNLTKEDLQKSYRKLAEQNFPDDQRIRFRSLQRRGISLSAYL